MADGLLFRTFYRAVKARAMMHEEAVPIQILRRDTMDRPDDKGQGFATRAWNFATSIYYKSKGFPGGLRICRGTSASSDFIPSHEKEERPPRICQRRTGVSTDVEPFALRGAASTMISGEIGNHISTRARRRTFWTTFFTIRRARWRHAGPRRHS